MTLVEAKDQEIEKDKVKFLEEVHRVHGELLDRLNYDKFNLLQADSEALRVYIRRELEKLLQKGKKIGNNDIDTNLVEAVLDEVLGFGPVEELLRDKTLTDIFINGPNNVFVERKGRVQKAAINFLNEDHIFRLVQRVAGKSGRHLDLGSPYFDAQLPDGSRLHAIIP
ncbi:MAG: ATPase, T2SS/T4P/T4SS family, partial [Waddliaceae bacterium]